MPDPERMDPAGWRSWQPRPPTEVDGMGHQAVPAAWGRSWEIEELARALEVVMPIRHRLRTLLPCLLLSCSGKSAAISASACWGVTPGFKRPTAQIT